MVRNRVRATGWLVSALFLVSVTGCGGDPAPKGDPSAAGSATGSTGSTSPTGSPFPSDAPLADGPWIPSLSFKFKVPKGFKGEQEMGVTTLRKGDLIITVYDPNGLGDSSTGEAIRTEQKLSFTGKPKVHVQPSSSVMTTTGRTTSCSWKRRSAPGSASRTLVSRTNVRVPAGAAVRAFL